MLFCEGKEKLPKISFSVTLYLGLAEKVICEG
jgi:hypothetical protein